MIHFTLNILIVSSSFLCRAFGTVYKAIEKTTGQKVAIKVATVSQRREDMFVKEIMALKMNCEHSNIIKYYDSYLLDDKLWVSSYKGKNKFFIFSISQSL